MKYSILSSAVAGRVTSDLGVSLFISTSSTVLVAVPGIGTTVATALDDDDDDDDRSAKLSRHSSMLDEKVTLFDVLLGLDAALASDQSMSSYIACISCDDDATEDLARGGGSGGLGLGRGTVNPVRYGFGRITFGDPGPLHSLRVSGDRGRMM